MTSADLTDLLHRIARSDKTALETLYIETSPKLFGIIVRILKRREVAEEILLEVYCRIWEHASRYDARRVEPLAWLATTARNRALDELRRREPAFAADPAGMFDFSDPGKTQPEQFEMSQELYHLENCFETLEEERREAIKLAYLDGFSRKDLALQFDQPISTIKTWLHRGLTQLKDCLGT